MTKDIAKNIVRGITDKIEASTTDIDDWADFWGFTRDDYEEFLEMCTESLEQKSILDNIKEEVKQLPITDTAVKLVTEVIDKYINRELYEEIEKAAYNQDLTFVQDCNGHNFALMDLDWIGYFDTLEDVAEYLGIL